MRKPGSDCCKLSHKTTKEEVLAVAKEAGMDAEEESFILFYFYFLDDGIFILKKEQRTHRRLFLLEGMV